MLGRNGVEPLFLRHPDDPAIGAGERRGFQTQIVGLQQIHEAVGDMGALVGPRDAAAPGRQVDQPVLAGNTGPLRRTF